jgi:MFS family permease
MNEQTSQIDDVSAKRTVLVLVIAQAFLGSQMPMLFVVAGLAGQQITPYACLSTLPISLIVFGSMTTAPWLSKIMQLYGRKKGFVIGAFGGFIGAAIGAFALSHNNFWLFLIGSYMTGIYMSAQGFFRFAVTDNASTSFRPKAISYVMAGGLVSAVLGPQVAAYFTGFTSDSTVARFIPIYYAAMAFNLIGLFIFLFLKTIKVPSINAVKGLGRSRRELLTDPRVLVAVICAAVSYSLMNLVMTSTPLAVVGCGFTEPVAANIVTVHVLAMFAPAFFTGHLIARFGVEKIMAVGLAFLTLACVVALQGVQLRNFYGALFLLGIGWNFGLIGATSMLAGAHTLEERGRIQGLNDLIVFGSVTIASLTSGGLMSCIGSNQVQGWIAVNLTMLPFLTLAVGSLIWLLMRQRSSVA